MYRIAIISPDRFLWALLCNSLSLVEAEVACYERWNEQLIEPLSHFNLILTLESYPFLNGSDVAHRLRARGGSPRIYVLSWLHDEQNVLSLLESGVDQYFTLPVNVPRLCGKVAAQINEWRKG